MNATSFVKYSKLLFHARKHKYIYIYKIKSKPHKTYFWISNVYLKQLFSLDFSLKNFTSHKLVRKLLFKLLDLYTYVSY